MMVCLVAVPFVFADSNCTSLPHNITIQIDAEPYISPVVNFMAYLPSAYKTQSVKCWSYVSSVEGNIQQVNPQKTEYSKTFFSFPKSQETREYFTAQNGVVSAYLTNKNLVSYTTFVLGVRCVSENTGDTIIGEKCITPMYNDLKAIPARGVWTVQNMDLIVILIVFGIFALIILFMFWDSIKRMLK
jgi:hypothetical protein